MYELLSQRLRVFPQHAAFDGVLTMDADDGDWTFLVFNTLIYNGRDLQRLSLRSRLTCGALFAANALAEGNFDIVHPLPGPLDELKTTLVSKMGYHIEGFVVTDGETFLKKWNHPEKTRAMLRVTADGDLATSDGTIVGDATMMDISGDIVECLWHGYWKPIKACIDRNRAQTLAEVKAVQETSENFFCLEEVTRNVDMRLK